jgi:small subunit ribosomal protein S21|tara:strand:+ start:209 stop:454 length:246 start_codon:yes stop_codon:yes gene_type:complete
MPQVTPRKNRKSNKVEPFDRMLRRFKKDVEKAGIIQEVRKREFFVPPSQKKYNKKKDIVRKRKIELEREKREFEMRARSRW